MTHKNGLYRVFKTILYINLVVFQKSICHSLFQLFLVCDLIY